MPKKRKPSSPYWDWIGNHYPSNDSGQALEPVEANPDVLPHASTDEPDKTLSAAIHVVTHGGLDCLTERQRQVYQLVVDRGFTVGRSARILGISRQAAGEHLKAAGRKLKEKVERKLRRANTTDDLEHGQAQV